MDYRCYWQRKLVLQGTWVSWEEEGLRQTSLNDRLSNFEGLALMNIAQGSVLNELS
jgi:hypothetical protein